MQEHKDSPVAAFPVDPILAAAHDKHLKKVTVSLLKARALSPPETLELTPDAVNPPQNREGALCLWISPAPPIFRRCLCAAAVNRVA